MCLNCLHVCEDFLHFMSDNIKLRYSIFQDKKYLCIIASDNSGQSLTQYFEQCIDFIHDARLEGGRVLIHWYV
jgi:protein-tyrosine phosphatase